MSQIRFQCYVCNKELQVSADKAGRKAKCVECGTVLTIPAAAQDEAPPSPGPQAPSAPQQPFQGDEPAPRRRPREDDYDRPRDDDRPRGDDRGRDDDYDRPRRSRRDDDYDRPRGDDRGRGRDDDYDDRRDDYDDFDDRGGAKAKKWKTNFPRLKLGMLLSFIGMCVIAGGFGLEHIGVLIGTIASFSRGGTAGGTAVEILALIGNIIMLLGFLCLLTGQVFWIFISNKQAGLTWAIVALSVGGVAFLMYLILRFIPIVSKTQFPYGFLVYFQRGSSGVSLGNAIVPIFTMIFIAAHLMMNGFYLRAFGKTLKDRMVTGRGMQIVITAGIAAGYQLIWPFIGWAFMSPGAGVGALIGIWIFYWISVIIFILLFIASIITLNMCRIIAD